MPIPNWVTLSPELNAFLGPFAGAFTAFFNIIAIVTVMWFIVIVGIQVARAFQALRNETPGSANRNTMKVVQDTALNLVEVIALALIVFLLVTNGPNVLYFIATEALGLVNPTTSDVSSYAGPFAGLFRWMQTNLAIAVILFGTAYLLWRAFTVYRTSGTKREGYAFEGENTNNFARLKDVVEDVWQTAVLIVLLFLAVRYGPQLLFDLLGASRGAIGS